MHTLMRTCALGAAVLAATTNATANIAVGAFDPNTGLTWAYATTLEEGTQSGYRAASGADLHALLSNGGFYTFGSAQSGNASLYLTEGGFYNTRYPVGQLGDSPVRVNEVNEGGWRALSALGLPLTAGTTGEPLSSNSNGAKNYGYVLGYLDGDTGDMAFVSRYIDYSAYRCYGTGCPGGSFGTVGVVSSQLQGYSAAWGDAGSVTGQINQAINDSSRYTALPAIDLGRVGYFMVKPTASAVPEASTAWCWSLGLLMFCGLMRARQPR